MKIFAFVALLAFVATPLLTAQTMGTSAAKEQVKDPVAKLVAIIKKTNKITAGINDAASAEAAVPALKKCRERVIAMQPELEKALSSMSPEQSAELFISLAVAAGEAQKDVERIRANGFYGCEALKKLLTETAKVEIKADGAPAETPCVD